MLWATARSTYRPSLLEKWKSNFRPCTWWTRLSASDNKTELNVISDRLCETSNMVQKEIHTCFSGIRARSQDFLMISLLASLSFDSSVPFWPADCLYPGGLTFFADFSRLLLKQGTTRVRKYISWKRSRRQAAWHSPGELQRPYFEVLVRDRHSALVKSPSAVRVGDGRRLQLGRWRVSRADG